MNDKQAITQRLKDKIDLQTREDRFINLPAILKIAASIILITSISILGYYKSTGLRNWIDPVQYVLITVPVGQKIKLTLKNDGSTVILNSGSTDSLEKILFAIAKANKLTYSIKEKVVYDELKKLKK